MIIVENIDVWGFEHAIRGMRNPMNSGDKSDSWFKDGQGAHKLNGERMNSDAPIYGLGPNDLELMKKLYKAGPEHRKYLRQIMVSMDITAPLYWWKQADQYKIGTVTNSTSTMHKIHAKEFVLSDFSVEHLDPEDLDFVRALIKRLNKNRDLYMSDDDPDKRKAYWWKLIQLLPSSYNQKRTITMNYENVISIIHQRKGHKLDEWRELVNVFIFALPYIREITGETIE